MRTRSGRKGGGIAIVCHRKVKCVPLAQYEVDGLEAVWAEVMCDNIRFVVGSIYISLQVNFNRCGSLVNSWRLL